MSPLQSHITALIRASGPLTLAEFMALCLQHPEHGYYTTRDPLGASGDFTTSPEISQMFGEMLALALANSLLPEANPANLDEGQDKSDPGQECPGFLM